MEKDKKTIHKEFLRLKDIKSDINEHMQTLYDYGSKCAHITEFGAGRSTFALAASGPKKFVCYDIKSKDGLLRLFEEYLDSNFDFTYFQKSTLEIEIEKTDLLFIDTKHTYKQLSQELDLHAKNVKKYIIMHDTEIFGHRNEFPEEHPNIGLVPARDKFLKLNEDWAMEKHFRNNNGLSVLKRVKE